MCSMQIFIAFIFYLLTLSVVLIDATHSGNCIILPTLQYKDEEFASTGMEKFPQTAALWSNFEEPTSYGAMLDSAVLSFYGVTYAYPYGVIRVYKIQTRHGLLNGWYRIEIKIVASKKSHGLQDSVKVLLLDVLDDNYRRQNIGEFVYHFPTDDEAYNGCPKNDATKYMIISCGGASRSEPLVSNTIVYVRNNTKKDGKNFPREYQHLEIVPDLGVRTSMNFYVRIPIQDCNQKKAIFFRLRAIMDKLSLDPQPQKDTYYTANAVLYLDESAIPGTADALPGPSEAKYLKCDEEIKELQASTYPWYVQQFYNVGIGPNTPVTETRWLHACQGSLFSGRCKLSYLDLFTTYNLDANAYELRQITNQNEARPSAIPICEHRPPERSNYDGIYAQPIYMYAVPKKFNNISRSTIPKTGEYLKEAAKNSLCNEVHDDSPTCKITSVVKIPMVKSRKRSHRRSLNDGKGEPSKKGKNYTGVLFRDGSFTTIAWTMRRGHGCIMSVIFFFLLPVNLFLTRYFKESFMDRRILLARVWYQAHIQGSYLITALFVASIFVALMAKMYLGFSLTYAGKYHRLLGWGAAILFAIMTALGGFRGYEDRSRKMTIILHWFCGLLFYVLMIVEMVTAVFIPGSGIASDDQSQLMGSSEQSSGYATGAFISIMIWILFEIVMHAMMMYNLSAFDKKMVVVENRMYLPVPIPVIPEHSKTNADGHGLRVVVLGVYIGFAFTFTAIFYIIAILNIKSDGKGFGPMSCTHDPDTWELFTKFPEACRW